MERKADTFKDYGQTGNEKTANEKQTEKRQVKYFSHIKRQNTLTKNILAKKLKEGEQVIGSDASEKVTSREG